MRSLTTDSLIASLLFVPVQLHILLPDHHSNHSSFSSRHRLLKCSFMLYSSRTCLRLPHKIYLKRESQEACSVSISWCKFERRHLYRSVVVHFFRTKPLLFDIMSTTVNVGLTSKYMARYEGFGTSAAPCCGSTSFNVTGPSVQALQCRDMVYFLRKNYILASSRPSQVPRLHCPKGPHFPF